jgi:hypothetical protein
MSSLESNERWLMERLRRFKLPSNEYRIEALFVPLVRASMLGRVAG